MLKERRNMAKVWKETTPDFKQFEKVGDIIEGELLGYTDIQIKGITVKRWQMRRLSDGIAVGFLGGVSLDSMLEAVPVGSTIKLEFVGKVSLGGGMAVKKFKMFEEVEGEEEKAPEVPPTPKKKK